LNSSVAVAEEHHCLLIQYSTFGQCIKNM